MSIVYNCVCCLLLPKERIAILEGVDSEGFIAECCTYVYGILNHVM